MLYFIFGVLVIVFVLPHILPTKPTFIKQDVLEGMVSDLQQALKTSDRIYWRSKFYIDFSGMSLGSDTISIYQNPGLFRIRKLLVRFEDSGTFPDFLQNRTKRFSVPIGGQGKMLVEDVVRKHLDVQ